MAADDRGLYARSFADVYDQWYGDRRQADLVADAISDRVGRTGVVLELGSGTGRLAGAIRGRGIGVVELDVSQAMLQQSPGPNPVAADMAQLPLHSGSVDLALVATNTLFNLDADSQRRCMADTSRVLRSGGELVVDAFVAATRPSEHVGTTVRPHPIDPAGLVVIVTSRDPAQPDHIDGAHIELRVEGTTCRPWQLCYRTPAELDELAATAGLTLLRRSADWAGAMFDPAGARHVSWYRRDG